MLIEEKIPSATTLTCKTCGAANETAVHILLSCNFAKRIWEAITNWLKIPMINIDGSLSELLQEVSEIQRSRKIKKVIHAVVVQTMWILWKIRNEKVFSGTQGVLQTAIEDIKETSFQGVKLRSKFHAITRQEWWDLI
ncbi:hypothetical protein HanRHA438_Chr02g0092791 [Helianthus annuus]|nr:hypothetical protein HanRHA438_Chr02g0092791 [Helianthus annuus]